MTMSQQVKLNKQQDERIARILLVIKVQWKALINF